MRINRRDSAVRQQHRPPSSSSSVAVAPLTAQFVVVVLAPQPSKLLPLSTVTTATLAAKTKVATSGVIAAYRRRPLLAQSLGSLTTNVSHEIFIISMILMITLHISSAATASSQAVGSAAGQGLIGIVPGSATQSCGHPRPEITSTSMRSARLWAIMRHAVRLFGNPTFACNEIGVVLSWSSSPSVVEWRWPPRW
ncbi:hypothetical protein SCLCIDRAFT_1026825 [Scleroderma citrinum Foug A]|uniref:Uncharacterized protein n=1 Tax=Scleroderma citrinum Foug A TaxID=1036808 RepID=A0A0C2ZBS5_9AGAM|nr:hypothetical protein SCLCIDRAFT_1026825 [Scleroderma citrinum Foug A]